MQRFAVFVLAALVLAPAGVAAPRMDTASLGPTQSGGAATQQKALENGLVRAINVVRKEHGLKPLALSAKLSAAASAHTREMGTKGYFEHESYDSTDFWKRISRWYTSKGKRTWSVGENLLYSSPDVSADEGVELWMGSPGHRANILSRQWREIGISAMHFESAPGEFEDAPVPLVTADFCLRK